MKTASYFLRLKSHPCFLVVLAFALVLMVFFDYAQSGTIRLRDVKLTNQHQEVAKTVTLPHSQASPMKGAVYEFAFTLPANILNLLFPVMLWPDDCLIALKADGSEIPLSRIAKHRLCSPKSGISLNQLGVSSARDVALVASVLDKTATYTGLRVERMSYLKPFSRIIILVFSAYLLSLLAVESRSQFKRLHYQWLVISVFVFSFWPRYYDLQEWWESLSFLANGLAIAFVCLIGCYWAPTRALYRWLDSLLPRVVHLRPKRFVGLCMLAFFLLTACLSQLLFDGLPHVADTHSQYMQSKIYADGKLYAPSHALKNFFSFQNVVDDDGKYYSATFPGHSMLLAVGQLLGVPWLLNPLMGALTLGMVFLLARELAGRAAGYVASVLVILSPMIVFMSSEYMNHASTMLFLTLFLYGYIRMLKTGHRKYALLAGGAIGMAFLIRAHSAVPFALLLALHALWQMVRGRSKGQYQNYAIIVASFSVFLAILLYIQQATTGHALLPAYIRHASGNNPLTYAFWGKGFDEIIKQLLGFQDQAGITHSELFGWPTSSFWGIFLLYFFSLNPPYSKYLLLAILSQFIGFVFIYPTNGGAVFLPNRYVYESSACLIVLTAIAIVRLPQLLSFLPYARGAIAATLVVLTLLAFPYRIVETYRTYSDRYWEGDKDLYYMVSQSTQKPALVFVNRYVAYRLVYFTQPPSDSNPIIFALDQDGDNQQLMDYYPNRVPYMLNGYSLSRLR